MIGVFDSGLGGLTVVRALRARLPAERILYAGDTARIPWGTKSPETIRRYAVEIAAHLVRRGARAIVVACHTASAVALDAVRTVADGRPVVGVVAPGAARAAAASRTGRIGVLATRATVRSGAYERAILSARPGAAVVANAAPLLVPLVEEGILDGPIVEEALRRYAGPLLEADVDVLLLGCTHYPLLAPAIRRFVGEGVEVVDSAAATAEVASALSSGGGGGGLLCVVSDAPDAFRAEGERFLGAPLGPVERVESFTAE